MQAIGNDYATVANCWSEYMNFAEAAIFEYAFKLGMQIAIESWPYLFEFGKSKFISAVDIIYN